MGIVLHRRTATGLATCQICHKKIAKGLPVIYASGYRESGYCHQNPRDCGEPIGNWREELENE